MSNDILWIAAQIPNADVRLSLLRQAALDYEDRDWTEQGSNAGDTIILDTQAALQHDRWALVAACGDPLLAPVDYWRSRRWLVTQAAAPRHPLLGADTLRRATADIIGRYGVAAAIQFLKDAWTHQLVLSLDGFFVQFHTLLRAKAWGISYAMALDELRTRAPEARSTSDRGRVLASLDAEQGREPGALSSVLEDEFVVAEARLSEARKRPYSEFLRVTYTIRPIFYCLRDLYWELHFLSGEGESGSCLEQERLVDEWQADMFQLLFHPYGAMVQLGLEANMDTRAVRRHLDFWTRGRVQLNEQMYAVALDAFQKGGTAMMVEQLSAAIQAALDPSQVAALAAYEGMMFDGDDD